MNKKVNVKSFYIQPGDNDVAEWVSKQYNLSHSLRWLVKQAIAQYGMTDYQDSLFDDRVIGERSILKHESDGRHTNANTKKHVSNKKPVDNEIDKSSSEQIQNSRTSIKPDNTTSDKLNLLGLDKNL